MSSFFRNECIFESVSLNVKKSLFLVPNLGQIWRGLVLIVESRALLQVVVSDIIEVGLRHGVGMERMLIIP